MSLSSCASLPELLSKHALISMSPVGLYGIHDDGILCHHHHRHHHPRKIMIGCRTTMPLLLLLPVISQHPSNMPSFVRDNYHLPKRILLHLPHTHSNTTTTTTTPTTPTTTIEEPPPPTTTTTSNNNSSNTKTSNGGWSYSPPTTTRANWNIRSHNLLTVTCTPSDEVVPEYTRSNWCDGITRRLVELFSSSINSTSTTRDSTCLMYCLFESAITNWYIPQTIRSIFHSSENDFIFVIIVLDVLAITAMILSLCEMSVQALSQTY